MRVLTLIFFVYICTNISFMIEIENKSLNGLKFIDLFAGIGGFHLALKSFGAECVFASEIDKYAVETYSKNFKLIPSGDVKLIDAGDIPSHDILCAGFPCQPFSVSGKMKGFEDKNGVLFFEIVRILESHNPKFLILENVKNIVNHNGGETLKTIIQELNKLNYNIYYKVVNTSDFGLPQKRERVFFFGFRKDIDKNNFTFVHKKISSCLFDIIDEQHNAKEIKGRKDIFITKQIFQEKKLFDDFEFENKPIRIGYVNKGGQGERIYHPLGHSVTLSANGGGVGAKTGLYLIDGKIRKLSPRECARLQGYPDSFNICDNYNQAIKQFGNGISVDVLQYLIKNNINSYVE